MAQNYQDIPATQTLSSSRSLLLDRDEAVASSFSGSAFPSTNLLIGMRCHRTDLNKIYVLKNLTPTWVEVEDVGGTTGLVPRATTLATSRSFSVTGDVSTAAAVSFNGSADVTLSVALATQVGLVAATYGKVTVNTKGLVTAGAALANSDLPSAISQNTLRSTSTTAVTLASTAHGYQVGADAGTNLAFDTAAIQARNNGAAAAVTVNALGGNVTLGDNVTSQIALNGTLVATSIIRATQAEAEAGNISNKVMTPLQTAQALAFLAAGSSSTKVVPNALPAPVAGEVVSLNVFPPSTGVVMYSVIRTGLDTGTVASTYVEKMGVYTALRDGGIRIKGTVSTSGGTSPVLRIYRNGTMVAGPTGTFSVDIPLNAGDAIWFGGSVSYNFGTSGGTADLIITNLTFNTASRVLWRV
jgi:hypothetical protein